MSSHEKGLPILAVNLVSEAPVISPRVPSRHGTTSGLETPDRPVASSPILRIDGLTPSHAASERQSARNSYRNSNTSSLRLSRDLSELRWDGSPLREDDSIFNGSEDHTKRGYRAGSESEAEATQQNVTTDQITYSTLSKRADLILANAKKKLTLLEGNLGRARHSLVIAPHHMPELGRADSTASTQSAPFLSKDQDKVLGKGPKITFGPPRSSLSSPHLSSPRHQNGRSGAGHSRVFSDTSIPSQAGTTIVGSRSLQLLRDDESASRQFSSRISAEMPDSSLDTVPEYSDAAGGPCLEQMGQSYAFAGFSARNDAQSHASQSRHSVTSPPTHSRPDMLKEQSRNNDFDSYSAKTLQENSELEYPIETGNVADLESVDMLNSDQGQYVQQDSRAEWHQVLERHQGESMYSLSYTDDGPDLENEKIPDALTDEILDDDGADFNDQPHETRNDAFDYEHFILHSIMGNGIRRTSSISRSTTSASQSFENDESNADQHDGWIDSAQLDEHDRQEQKGEETTSTSGTESDHENANESLNGSWPVPPSSRESLSIRNKAFKSKDKHNHTSSKVSKSSTESARRPESEIVSRLLVHSSSEKASEELLAAEDSALFYAVAESLREVCMRLQHGNLGPHDGVDLRQRLEIARRVLKGEL